MNEGWRVWEEEERDRMEEEEEEGSAGDVASSAASCLRDDKVSLASEGHHGCRWVKRTDQDEETSSRRLVSKIKAAQEALFKWKQPK